MIFTAEAMELYVGNRKGQEMSRQSMFLSLVNGRVSDLVFDMFVYALKHDWWAYRLEICQLCN